MKEQKEKDKQKIDNLENLLDKTAVEMIELKNKVKKYKDELIVKAEQSAKEKGKLEECKA